MCNKSADKTGFLYFCMQHSVFLCLLFHCLSKVLGDPRGVQGDWHEPLRPEVRLAIGCSSSPRKGSWLPGRWPSLESQQPPPSRRVSSDGCTIRAPYLLPASDGLHLRPVEDTRGSAGAPHASSPPPPPSGTLSPAFNSRSRHQRGRRSPGLGSRDLRERARLLLPRAQPRASRCCGPGGAGTRARSGGGGGARRVRPGHAVRGSPAARERRGGGAFAGAPAVRSGRCGDGPQGTDDPSARRHHAFPADAAAATAARPGSGGPSRAPAAPEVLRAARALAARRGRGEEEEAPREARGAALQLLALGHPEEAAGSARPGPQPCPRQDAAAGPCARPAPGFAGPCGGPGHVRHAPASRPRPQPCGGHLRGDLRGGGGRARRRHALLLEPHPRGHPGHPEAPPGEAAAGAAPQALPFALGRPPAPAGPLSPSQSRRLAEGLRHQRSRRAPGRGPRPPPATPRPAAARGPAGRHARAAARRPASGAQGVATQRAAQVRRRGVRGGGRGAGRGPGAQVHRVAAWCGVGGRRAGPHRAPRLAATPEHPVSCEPGAPARDRTSSWTPAPGGCAYGRPTASSEVHHPRPGHL
ncbi:proline-rich protein 18 isoform X1 [Castor canadensis]|uniref:Proline-rich protein 18 isoform X1 n=1 Tax=Castor canadensis TaxID=51338 RepID=A0AC58MBD5_CASCN